MLRLPDINSLPKPTRKFYRLFIPHIGLVILTAVYLVAGALVFVLLERAGDERSRYSTKQSVHTKARALLQLFDTVQIAKSHRDIEYISPNGTENDTVSLGVQGTVNASATDLDPVLHFAGILMQKISICNDCEDRPSLHRVHTEREKFKKALFELLKEVEAATRASKVDEYTLDNISAEINYGATSRPVNNSWTLSASVLFTFTIITTIGYGNIAPNTRGGRLFCMFYGLIGIPLTMLAIANIGRFLSEGTEIFVDKIRREIKYRRLLRLALAKQKEQRRRPSRLAGQFLQEVIQKEDIKVEPLAQNIGNITILVVFVVYIILGALCIPLWEELEFFDSCYFNFVTITTVGFGDIVPRKYDYLFPTLVYISVGLAITTLSIQAFGDALRKIHFLGSKIKGAKNALIWFGNKMLTVGDLVNAIGTKYGIPQAEIESLNQELDTVIAQTVVAKEQEQQKRRARNKRLSLRDSRFAPLFYDSEFRYIDEDSLVSTPLRNDSGIC